VFAPTRTSAVPTFPQAHRQTGARPIKADEHCKVPRRPRFCGPLLLTRIPLPIRREHTSPTDSHQPQLQPASADSCRALTDAIRRWVRVCRHKNHHVLVKRCCRSATPTPSTTKSRGGMFATMTRRRCHYGRWRTPEDLMIHRSCGPPGAAGTAVLATPILA